MPLPRQSFLFKEKTLTANEARELVKESREMANKPSCWFMLLRIKWAAKRGEEAIAFNRLSDDEYFVLKETIIGLAGLPIIKACQ